MNLLIMMAYGISMRRIGLKILRETLPISAKDNPWPLVPHIRLTGLLTVLDPEKLKFSSSIWCITCETSLGCP
jgi:hypothetical protein